MGGLQTVSKRQLRRFPTTMFAIEHCIVGDSLVRWRCPELAQSMKNRGVISAGKMANG